MTYIYDVLLNFTDEKNIVEFFEWEENDTLEHIKRIPLIRVSTSTLDDFINNNVKVEKQFLEKIKDTTIMYRKTKNLEYAVLVSDLNKVIAIEFNKKGEVISKSSLLLDEEDEIIEEAYDINQEQVSYIVQGKINKDNFLTRAEIKRQKYLLKEIENIYTEKNNDKFQYLYEELYSKDNLSLQEKYSKLKKDIEENYSNKHNLLYEIVRLTYIKK